MKKTGFRCEVIMDKKGLAIKNALGKAFCALCCVFFACMQAFAAEDTLINIKPSRPMPGVAAPRYAPGVVIRLPDGRQGTIETVLPNGNFRTDLGVILLPDGTIAGQPDHSAVIISPEAQETIPEVLETPKAEELPKAEDTTVTKPETLPALLPGVADETQALPKGTETPKATVTAPAVTAPENTVPEAQKGLTLAELLPLTAATQSQPQVKSKEEPAQVTVPKEDKKKPEAKTPQKEAVKKPEQKETPQAKKQEKAKTGQELHIPEEAIKTGKLDFLEGCWEGRRPEYYSKRIIRECFCFDANGGSGKRRIFDIQGERTCIGSSRASLSKNGVLSVTSQGAACDDGERWGQAEMVCRSNGAKSPCSWVFKDAQNGRQTYTIPFVKVESCRR